ncbi:Protein M3 [Basidiobolus ranarum]|uniref:Protein M3 n=1 Tax=Basidiobolus ranarum TaxID=34480 RepID=A0ABR2WQV7_9FUNG
MVTSINTENLPQMGILACVVLFYIFLGGLFGLGYRFLLPLPKNFRNGFVAASIWANWGDLPLAVMTSVGDSPPFKPGDSSIGVAYMSVFIVMFNLSLFTLGGYKLVQSDYREIEIDVEDHIATPNGAEDLDGLFSVEEEETNSLICMHVPARNYKNAHIEPNGIETSKNHSLQEKYCLRGESRVNFPQTECSTYIFPERRSVIRQQSEPVSVPMYRKNSSSSIPTIYSNGDILSTKKTCTSIANFHIVDGKESQDPNVRSDPIRTRTTFGDITDFDKPNPERVTKLNTRIYDIVAVIFSPPNVAIITGIAIGLIGSLKHMWVREGSDDQHEPPLEFLFQVISMIGAAYLPLSLANLGGALVNIDISAIPLYISLSFVAIKLVVTPVVGIFTVQFLTYSIHWFPVDDKPLRFLAMFASCVPTATSIMILSQFFSPTGEAKEVAALLVLQYLFGMITMVGTLAYILNLLSV